MEVIIIILSIVTVVFLGITCAYTAKAYKNTDTDMMQKGKKFSAGCSLFALVDIICIIIFFLNKIL